METISIVFGNCINISPVSAKKLNYIVISLIAGEMDWTPIIKALPVNFNRVTILPFLNHCLSLVILALLAVLPQLFVILMDVYPKISPIKLKIGDI